MQFNPAFRYNPDLFWDADPSHSKALIKPGPNNPVGVECGSISRKNITGSTVRPNHRRLAIPSRTAASGSRTGTPRGSRNSSLRARR